MSATMFELSSMREALEALIAEQEGEILPDQEALWDAIDERFEVKVENTALLIRERLAKAESVKIEAKRLADRAKALENDAERLKALLLDRMQHFGKEKVNGLLVTVALQNNPPRVEPLTDMDEAELRNVFMFAPEYVTRVPESYGLNKRAILDAHKAGTLDADIAKRVSIQQTTSLRIR